MPHPPGGRGRLATIAGAVALLLAGTGGAQASSEAPPGPTGPLAPEMAQLLESQPDAVQISDNAMAWDDGDAIVVWPDPGESSAPAGLGANVRTDLVRQLGIEQLAAPEASGDVSATGTASTCPWQYYCFYTGAYYDGARYQFSSTCSGSASSWGFNNVTSSWVNRNSGKVVYAYDYRGGAYLWTMSPGTSDPYVGSADNNRMGYWKCRYV